MYVGKVAQGLGKSIAVSGSKDVGVMKQFRLTLLKRRSMTDGRR